MLISSVANLPDVSPAATDFDTKLLEVLLRTAKLPEVLLRTAELREAAAFDTKLSEVLLRTAKFPEVDYFF